MAQTNPLSQLKYGALKNALRYARLGMRPKMREELRLAKRYSSGLGIPLAQSVKKYIQINYGELIKRAEESVVCLIENDEGTSSGEYQK